MVDGINTSGISIGKDGRISISGVSSGINSKAIIDAQIAARRAPAVTMEKNITSNNEKIAAYKELKTQSSSVTSALNKLRGNVGFTTPDVFKAKIASGTTAPKPLAPVGFTPSSINDLVVASVDQKAAAANHRITIQQLATAQQIRGDVVASTTAALGQTGTFSLNGKTITMAATDTLLDLRSKINSAGAGVNATVVSSSATANYLVITSTATGTDAVMNFAGGTAVSDALGLTQAGTVKTELQAAQNAILDVNGITGIVRQTNSVNDIIEGVTLSLTRAEPNTEITLKIEPDLNGIKQAMADFVKAYNDMRAFVSEQRTATDRNDDGVVDDDEFGPLAFDTTLRTIASQLGRVASTEIPAAADGFRSLNQIGITVNADFELQVDDSILDAKLLTGANEIRKLFTLDYTSSDARLSFQGRTSATVGGTYYVNLSGTDPAGAVNGGNINTTAGVGLGGASDGSLTGTGAVINATLATPANGLRLFFAGGNNAPPVDQIQITVSRGIADQFYDVFDSVSKNTSGQLDSLITQLQQQNIDYTSRIETLDSRIETFRTSLEQRFSRMEVALAQLEQIKNRIQQYTDQQSGGS